jgi:uncharacterized protein (TIGR02246 family)
MRTQQFWRAILLSLVGTVVACAPSGPAAFPQSDADAIREASKGFAQAASDTAWSRWAQYFTEDAAFLPPNTPIRTGRTAIEAWGRSFPPMKDLRIEPREIVGRDDVAYAMGAYSLTLVLPGGAAVADTGKYIAIWQKQADGSWKLIRDIFNSDIPVPAPPPAPTQRRD